MTGLFTSARDRLDGEYLQEFELTVTGPGRELTGLVLSPGTGFTPEAFLP